MANHCYNMISLSGSKEMLDLVETRLKEATKEQNNLWYETFFVVLGEEKQEGNTYDLFGSKWIDFEWVRESETVATMNGDSAWSPVLEFLVRLSSIYKLKINCTYEESGCDFGGWFAVYEGTVVDNRSASFDEYRYLEDPDSAIESFLDDIPVGCYDTTEQITNHSFWDKLTTEEKNVAIDTFNQYKS